MKHNGDVNVDAIFREVGYALTIWEGIEFSFVSLFCHFIEPRISNAAARAYGAISSSQGRMEALDKAAEVYFHLHKVPKDFKGEFTLIRKHFDKARSRRNEIAHANAISTAFAFKDGTKAGGFFLIPAMYGSQKNFAFHSQDNNQFRISKSKYQFTSDDISFFKLKFAHLQQAIFNFHGRFAAAYPPFEPK